MKEITEPLGNCGACLPTNRKNDGTEDGEQTIAERKQAQEAHTLELFNAMTNMFAALDVIYFTMELKYDESGKPVDGVFLEVNAATERLLGKSREQLIGKSRKELFGNFFDELPEKFDKVVKTGKPSHFEGYGGALKKCYDIYAWEVAENQVSVILRDITESKKAEEALEENENRLQNIMDAMDDGLVLMGLDSKVIDCNKASLRQLGLTGAELIGNNVTNFIVPEEKQDSVMDCKLQIQKTGKAVTQVKAFRKDKLTFPAEVSITALYDRNKKPIGLLGVARDITERKDAEDALRKSETRLRLIAQAGRIGFFEYNASKDIAYWSPEHYELLGYEQGTVISWQRWLQGVHPEDRERVIANAARLMERGRSEGHLQGHKDEYRFICPNGSIVWIESDLSLSMVNNEAIIRGSVRDITKRKKAEEALRQSEHKLEEYNKDLEKLVEERTKQLKDAERLAAIGATAGMVGHDIRNPLQAIASDVYLAKSDLSAMPEGEAKEGLKESLDGIDKNVEYINKIVQDLQDYARPLNPKIEESDLKSIIEALIVKNGLPKNIKVSVKIAEDARRIRADAYYLNRIFFNLVTNAVQAMPNGGTLTIGAHKEGNDTMLSVEDTGVGIPMEIQNKMFTLMFTTKSKGQGFGLPVVKRMTESLGGTVTFESQEGKGTTFILRFPPPRAKR